jgi:hypothetical protein
VLVNTETNLSQQYTSVFDDTLEIQMEAIKMRYEEGQEEREKPAKM